MNPALFAQYFGTEATPLVRTDFSSDEAWGIAVRAAMAEADFGASGLDGDGMYAPNISTVEDAEFEGATGATLAEVVTGRTYGYALLADARTMREATAGGELTVVYVDLSVSPEDTEEFGDVLGREFRCEVSEVASIEANLSIANMDFEEFADNVQEDGVFRGFSA